MSDLGEIARLLRENNELLHRQIEATACLAGEVRRLRGEAQPGIAFSVGEGAPEMCVPGHQPPQRTVR